MPTSTSPTLTLNTFCNPSADKPQIHFRHRSNPLLTMHRFIQFAFKVRFGVFSQESRIHQYQFFFQSFVFLLRHKVEILNNLQSNMDQKKSDFSLHRCFHSFVYLFFFPPDSDSSFSPRIEGSPRFFFQSFMFLVRPQVEILNNVQSNMDYKSQTYHLTDVLIHMFGFFFTKFELNILAQ